MAMDLHPTLEGILDDFLHCEVVRVLHQAAELEAALKLHQARMKDVCHSIKAHDHWVNYGSTSLNSIYNAGSVGTASPLSLTGGGIWAFAI